MGSMARTCSSLAWQLVKCHGTPWPRPQSAPSLACTQEPMEYLIRWVRSPGPGNRANKRRKQRWWLLRLVG
jgi:hypothetical protein